MTFFFFFVEFTTGGHPTPSDVANAGFKSAEKILAKVDMGALQDAADQARTKEDKDFAALVQEKRDAGKLAEGAKFLVATFALQSDPRFKAVKKRAEELYKAILRREKTTTGGAGGAAAAGGAGSVPAPAGRRRAMPPPPQPQHHPQHQRYDRDLNLQPCAYVVGAGAEVAPQLGGPPQLATMTWQQQQQQQQQTLMQQQRRMMQQNPPGLLSGYRGYGYGPQPPQPLQPSHPPQPQTLQYALPGVAPPLAPPGPPLAPVPPPAPPPAPAPPRSREDRAASPKRARVEDEAGYRQRDRD